MKKGLALLLAASMSLSAFSSAFAAELTAQEKFDALKAKGIFEGYTDGTAGLDKEMTRAEFAMVLKRLMKLEEVKPATPTFKDLKTDAWYYGAIEAAVKAGYINGLPDGTFAPSANVTYEQLAKLLVGALNLEVDANATVEGTVSPKMAGYVKAALDAGLITAQSNYKAAVKRDVLVSATYVADATINKPVAQLGAKVVGAKKIEVTFNKAVDKAKAKFSLKRGAINVAIEKVEFNEAATVATITAADKFSTANYTLTVEGVEGLEKNTFELAATAETVAALEFTGDVLPISGATEVPFAVKNQYGETMDLSLNNGDFTFILSTAAAKVVPDAKKLIVDLDDTANGAALLKADDALTVTAVYKNGVQASKTYKIGAPAVLTTVALKEVVNSDKEAVRLTEGGKATVTYEVKDQYGNVITDYSKLSNANTGVRLIVSNAQVTASWKQDTADNTKGVIELDFANVTADATVVLTAVTPGGKTHSITFNVYKKAAIDSFDVGSPTSVVADGDTNIYLPLTAVDQFGGAVSAQAIADAYADTSVIKVFAASTSVTIDTYRDVTIERAKGDNQGKLKIAKVSGTGSVTLTVVSKTGKTDSVTFNVEPARYSSKVEVSDAGAAKLLQGAETELKIKVVDQYGQEVSTQSNNVHANVEIVKVSGDDAGLTHNVAVDANKNIADELAVKTVKLTAAAGKKGTYTVNVKLVKTETVNNQTVTTTLSTVSKTYTVIDGKEAGTELTYAVADIPTLYKNGSASNEYKHVLSVTATDKDGNKVAIPASIANVAISNNAVAYDSVTKSVYGTAGDKSAIVTIVLNTPQGNQVVSKTVTVSNEDLAAASVKGYAGDAEKTEVTVTASATPVNLLSKNDTLYFVVTDQFGGDDLSTTNELDFVITNNKNANVVVLNDTSSFAFTKVNNETTTYTVTAVTKNGKSAIVKVIAE